MRETVASSAARMRYLTIAGQTLAAAELCVEVCAASGPTGDDTGCSAQCRGCGVAYRQRPHQWVSGVSDIVKRDVQRDEVREWAQRHAEMCRAMPADIATRSPGACACACDTAPLQVDVFDHGRNFLFVANATPNTAGGFDAYPLSVRSAEPKNRR